MPYELRPHNRGKRLFVHSFPFSIETQRPGAPPFNPVSPGGVEFFCRRLMCGPENLPKRPGPSGAKTAWQCRMAMPHHHAGIQKRFRPGRGAFGFLPGPGFAPFSRANSRPPKTAPSHGFRGLAAIKPVVKLGGLQAVPGRLVRRVKRAWPGGADFYNPGHSCLLPGPLAFSG